jgi:hypothetical protein
MRASGSGPYSVRGTVEAENVLGGRVSQSVSCTIRDDGPNFQVASDVRVG